MHRNPLTLIDGYKISHRQQYPAGTTKVYSNWTPRGTRVAGEIGIIFFGLQYFLKEYLGRIWKEGFFDLPKDQVVEVYRNRLGSYLGPNSIPLDHIEKLHDLGYLPLKFCAFPEGSFVPLRVPSVTVENTHPDHAWLVNYIETMMSNILWKPCTSATTARFLRKLLDRYADQTGGSKAFVQWQGHDFSFRGMSGLEDACLSGAGHLVSFTGTDTIPAIEFVEEFYGGNGDALIGGSVTATEHSVMCAGGKDGEAATYERLLDTYPEGILSIVSDTWDLWHVLSVILPHLKTKIMNRKGKLVVRPDSGDPIKIICGNPESHRLEAQLGVVELLWNVFGGSVNEKGFKTLDPHVGVIYGDSIDRVRMKAILDGLAKKGFASDNIVFGIGSFTYEFVTRDTYGFAMKATHTVNEHGEMALYKSPVTDDGEKWSAKGRLAVVPGDTGMPVLICDATPEQEAQSMLTPVWEDGKFLRTSSMSEIRDRAARG